jgi:subtilase family serine protease
MKKLVAMLSCILIACAAQAIDDPSANPLQLFTSGPHPPLITLPIDEANLVTLSGNTHPAAIPQNDLGPVVDHLQLDHVLLQLQRSPQQQREFLDFLDSLHDSQSSNYHAWTTAAELGRRFGLAQSDIDAVSNWLRDHGFVVNHVYPNMVIDFTGTAGQVREAFHTEIHNLNVNGETHIANMSDPMIPAALAPAIAGIVSLHDFRPIPMHQPKTDYTIGGGYYLVTPSDLHKIYNFGPVYSTHTGIGQTIAVMSESDAYNATGTSSDWNTFRKVLGLSGYTHGSFKQVHPAPGKAGACADPGVNGAAGEAAIDVEWSSAAAPNAAVVLASCKDSTTNAGLFIAMQNMLTNGGAVPNVISISYGSRESSLGTGGNAYINGLYQTAVAQGVSVFVSSGDSGADAGDQNKGIDSSGINVSGFASTPYDVAVGGTDYGDAYAGTSSTYWNSTNNASYGSAKSYIPEIPWNDSCASQLIAKIVTGSTLTYGTSGFCNSAAGASFINNSGGSGGPSSCSSGSSSTCKGYAKPSWQSLFGNPADGVRDIPDVALFAANGVWGHYYVVCFSDKALGGAACTGAPSGWAGFGGTSVAAPIWAGIQALVDNATGKRWGNPNSMYYSLARTEYGSTGNSSCNSSLGKSIGSSCIFRDVTLGDMDMPCKTKTKNCYDPSGTYGVISTSTSSYKPAYKAAKGWDFATGIGTINVANLVSKF